MGNTRARGSTGRRAFTLVEALVVLAILVVLIALLLPATRSSRGAARRAQCMNNLKQIALGLSNYEKIHGALPPASTLDAQGRPLQGWRTLILPHFEQESLYRTIDLAKPWDDAANARARETRLSGFACPASAAPGTSTTYLATLEPGGCLMSGEPRRIADVTDGAATTLLVIEAGDERAVPWMAPRDADESVVLGFPSAKLHHSGMNAAFVDGRVSFLRADISPQILRALTTTAGGEAVDPDSFRN